MPYITTKQPTSFFKFLLPSLSLALVVLSGCASQPAVTAPPPQPVDVVEAKMGLVEETSEFMGNLISRHSVSIDSKYAGIVRTIYVRPGQHVQKGQPLLEIVSDEERSTLASNVATSQATRSSIGQAQKSYEALMAQRRGIESTLTLNQTELSRYQRLKDLKSASQEEVDKYADAVNRNMAELRANQAQLQSQQEAIQAAQSNYRKSLADVNAQQVRVNERFIRAPFTGVVGEIPVKIGSYVQPLQALLTVTQNQSLELNVDLPSEVLARIKPGLTLRVLQEGKPIVSAPLSFIAPHVAVDTQTVLVKALFQNKEDLLRADQSVHAQIVWDEKPGMRVPVTAVLHMGGKDFLYFAEPDPKNAASWIAKQHPVELGPIQDQSYVVYGGLQPGVKVIVSGLQKLADGAPVQISTSLPAQERR